ncbi:3-isopropylmalate dehydratase small subunit [Nocardia sp. NPDC004568]|uniref:3-isopropylmalate dehydratase small subunit n=1 Tax=Nocardia sp. NPDC004568 TaxID=3154551 RepID=UPI0033A7518C
MTGATYTGVVAPLLIDNINTDLIIRSCDIPPNASDDFGRHLFACWRNNSEIPFVLDRPEYQSARILLTGANFGCGSSREAAVWALRDAGIQAILAPSFGAIFANNCVQHHIVPVVLPQELIKKIAALLSATRPTLTLTVEVVPSTVRLPDGRAFDFRLTGVHRVLLTTGRSGIDLIRNHRAAIADFQAHDRRRRPWLYSNV